MFRMMDMLLYLYSNNTMLQSVVYERCKTFTQTPLGKRLLFNLYLGTTKTYVT